ncbi:MAG: Coenzyme F420 hydrogenase/dehydrogenase, beta subunit C-terminal domain [Cellulomonadaceae bacterium]
MPPLEPSRPDYRKALLERIVSPDLNVNSGVYAALDPSIRMQMNARGEYEYLGLDGVNDSLAKLLLEVSAFGALGSTEETVAAELFGGGRGSVHSVIGQYRGLYAGHAVEGEFRDRGSSGGIASWLLNELLRTGRVDGVIHMVPDPGGSPLFSYRISRSRSEIVEGAKSHYYPGQLADVLDMAAKSGERFALTAIPSFAFEVRLLQQLRPEFRERIPYIVGLICGHQKTANYAAQLAWRVGIRPESLEFIDFRKKDPAASASRYLMEVHGFIDGERVVREARQGELFGTDWGHGLFKSNFSDFTEDAFNETADVVFGDAWLPRYVNDSAGTNVVIARNDEIDAMLRAAREDGRLHLEDCAPEDMVSSQAALVKQSVTELPSRFRYLAAKGEYVPPVRRPHPCVRVPLLRRKIQASRLKLSRQSHAAWEHALECNDLGVFDRELGPQLRRYRFWQRVARICRLPKCARARLLRDLG